MAHNRRFFYGWVIVALAFYVIEVQGGVGYSFGAFFSKVLAEFSLGMGVTSGVYFLYMVTSGLSGIMMWRLSDKYDPRLLAGFGGSIMGFGALLSSRITEI